MSYKHFKSILNGLARGLELERQMTKQQIGLDLPTLLEEVPPVAVRAVVDIDGVFYTVLIQPGRKS